MSLVTCHFVTCPLSPVAFRFVTCHFVTCHFSLHHLSLVTLSPVTCHLSPYHLSLCHFVTFSLCHLSLVTCHFANCHVVTLPFVTCHFATLPLCHFATFHFDTLTLVTLSLHHSSLCHLSLITCCFSLCHLSLVTLSLVILSLHHLSLVTLSPVTCHFVTFRLANCHFVTLPLVTCHFVTMPLVIFHFATRHFGTCPLSQCHLPLVVWGPFGHQLPEVLKTNLLELSGSRLAARCQKCSKWALWSHLGAIWPPDARSVQNEPSEAIREPFSDQVPELLKISLLKPSGSHLVTRCQNCSRHILHFTLWTYTSKVSGNTANSNIFCISLSKPTPAKWAGTQQIATYCAFQTVHLNQQSEREHSK